MSNADSTRPSPFRAGIRRRLCGGLYKVMMGRSLGWLTRLPAARRGQITTELRTRNWQISREDEESAAVHMRGMPVSLHLQTTSKCNFRCIMCTRQRDGFKPNREYPCMDEDLLRKIAREGFAYASSIDLTVSGEPLLASNLDETLRLAKLYNVPVNITTNGSLLGRAGMLDKLMPSLGILAVSLDAATPETLAKIRPGARFDDIVAALAECCKMRKAKRNGGEVRIAAVLMRENVQELPDMVRLAHKVGADTFAATHMVVVSPSLRAESLLEYPDLFNRYRAEAEAVAKSLGQTVVLPAPLNSADASDAGDGGVDSAAPIQGPIRCQFSHRSLYIRTDGIALPCCNEDPEIPSMGDAERESIREIWNSPPYLELREGLRTGRLTPYCRRCYIIADQVRVAQRGLMKVGQGV